VKHWVEIHAPMARACPGIGRYALTIVKSASTRKDVAPYEIQVDGIAELWFKSQADFDAYSTSAATQRLRDDGATFIGREIDFITEEKVIISYAVFCLKKKLSTNWVSWDLGPLVFSRIARVSIGIRYLTGWVKGT